MRQKKFSRKGISVVVSTILLVVIAIAAIGIVIGFIFPMVKQSLGKGKSCFDLREYFKIASSDYTCYNATNTQLMVERGMDNFTVKGFIISIKSEGASERYDIYDGAGGMRILEGQTFTDNVKIPNPGEARTYLFNTGNGKGADIAVLQEDNNICNAEFYSIPECIVPV